MECLDCTFQTSVRDFGPGQLRFELGGESAQYFVAGLETVFRRNDVELFLFFELGSLVSFRIWNAQFPFVPTCERSEQYLSKMRTNTRASPSCRCGVNLLRLLASRSMIVCTQNKRTGVCNSSARCSVAAGAEKQLDTSAEWCRTEKSLPSQTRPFPYTKHCQCFIFSLVHFVAPT